MFYSCALAAVTPATLTLYSSFLVAFQTVLQCLLYERMKGIKHRNVFIPFCFFY